MGDWSWILDADVQTQSTSFPSQAEAEAWLAETWAELADAGIRSVTLREGEFDVYGPMSLSEN